ncbi:hypothetical protein [Dyadobacter sp. CY312]|uniref:hypothetical protein n=1 Tax=Dyadobacter sp. CY312 TaxID=2907303 RepID=UPI001F3B3E81|nr:hypothetical protein [Dyadobacter sp. CY312]MCE7043064.1 hypothetical protein [Dyadobacter sp. CY312]
MKKFIIFLLVSIPIILSSCTGNDPKPSNLNIQGKWQLESFRGAWTGDEYSPGTGPVLIFQKKTYQELNGDTLLRSGSYKIVRAHHSVLNEEGDRLDLEQGNGFTFVSIHNDKLILSIDAYDAPSYLYRKIE